MTLPLALALLAAILPDSPASGSEKRDIEAIFSAVLTHYAKELKLKRDTRVCVNPEAPKKEFFALGMLRFASRLFEEEDLDRALQASQQHGNANVRPAILPPKFRLSPSHECPRSLEFLAPATNGDLAFIEVEYHLHSGGTSGGYKQIIALRRKASLWEVAAVKTLVIGS